MPTTKTITLYHYDELSDAAKQKARDWYIEGNDIDYVFEDMCYDAKNIGLKIVTLDSRRSNKGTFIDGAFNCANKIIAEHGKDCETYKTATKFLKEWEALPQPEDDCRTDDFDVIEADFLKALLEDYRILLNKDYEFHQSRECVEENIRAKDYTFTETGKRE